MSIWNRTVKYLAVFILGLCVLLSTDFSVKASQDEMFSSEAGQEQHWNDDNTLKILSIGNSFSTDSQAYAWDIAKNLGVENVKLGNLYIAGCSLEEHYVNAKKNRKSYIYHINDNGEWRKKSNYSIKKAVMSENWDYITFQQKSRDSGKASTYNKLNPLMKMVRKWCPDAKFAWNMTWADELNSTSDSFSAYDYDQNTMFKKVVSAVRKKIASNKKIDCIIPVGTALQNARTSYLGDTLTRDGHHLSYDEGRYIAGVTFVYALTGLDVDQLSYCPQGVNSKTREVAIESAKNAVKKPYKITKSTIKNKVKTAKELNVTAGKKKVTVRWKKANTQIAGYEIQYYLDDDFDNRTTVTVGKRKTSLTIKGLQEYKTYFVRIRSFQLKNGERVYSSWSVTKKITTKGKAYQTVKLS